MSSTSESGSLAEDAGLKFLERQGLKSVERNFSCRHGEIDLIMRDRDALVFVEVRYRGPGARVAAAETVDFKKQKRLRTTALKYLQLNRLNPDRTSLRFDILAMQGQPPGYEIDWIKNALD